MKDHFGISGLLYFLYSSGRYPPYFVFGGVVGGGGVFRSL